MKKIICFIVIIAFCSTILSIGASPTPLSTGLPGFKIGANGSDSDSDTGPTESDSQNSDSGTDNETKSYLGLTTTVTLVLAAIATGIELTKLTIFIGETTRALKKEIINLEDQVYEGEGADLDELSSYFNVPKEEICRIFDQLVLDGMNSDTNENAAELFIALINRLAMT